MLSQIYTNPVCSGHAILPHLQVLCDSVRETFAILYIVISCMTGKIYFILGSSFVMGILSGLFFYATVFIPEFAIESDSSEIIDVNTVVIEGKMYGGCQEMDACASFKLQDNKKYQYQATRSAKVTEGKIPKEINAELFSKMDVQMLSKLAQNITSSQCASFVDGLDYMYDVTKDGVTYTLNTCTTKLATESVLQERLLLAWEFMANPTTTYPVLIEDGPIQMIFDRFNAGTTTAQ